MSEQVLIVEPRADRLAVLAAVAEQAGFGHEIARAEHGPPPQESLSTFSMILVGGGNGREEALAFLRSIRQHRDAPPAIAQSSGDRRGAIAEFFSAGAVEVVTDDVDGAALSAAMRRTRDVARLDSDFSRIKGHSNAAVRLDDLKGATEEMERAVSLGERAARLQMHVLIEGEPGSGRQAMARAIHAESDRASRPVIALDSLELSPGAADTALFDRRTGAYWHARGGSLFIHEIAELPLSAQTRLATMLETPERPAREIFHDEKPEVRLFASSSQDMIPLVKSGAFRDDLFYRVNVCSIWIPPLRTRRADIAGLARGFMRAFALETGRRIESLSMEAGELLSRYDWPGNLPELEREVFRAVLMAEGRMLEPRHFPRIAAQVGELELHPECASRHVSLMGRKAAKGAASAALVEGMPASPSAGWQEGADRAYVGIPALTERGEVRPLEDIEADAIRLALGRYRGSMTEAARRLGIGRSTLYRKMREFGLDARGNAR